MNGSDDALEPSTTTESIKYPPLANIILIMLAVYITLFLVALVSNNPEPFHGLAQNSARSNKSTPGSSQQD
jgi:hypothetical protein